MIQVLMKDSLTKMADCENTNSWSSQFRGKRFHLFKNLIQSIPYPLEILDVGGRETIWKNEFYPARKEFKDTKITLLNITETSVTHPNIKAVVGDARNMAQFNNNKFDVIFSNSVIEHVGNYEDQCQMANEVKRVGTRYFLQTPNRYFPIEPHFLFPWFQFLPLWLKVWLIGHFDLGWRKKTTNREEAIKLVSSVRLMTKKELQQLFPEARIFEEKFLGMTKSFIVYKGW